MRLAISAVALLAFSLAAQAQDAAPPSAAPAPAEATPAPAEGTAPAALAAPADPAIAAAVAALSTAIGDVQIVGPWVDGERRGVWRTVMTQNIGEAAGNRFFVQQLEERDGTMSVATTTEVTEIASVNGAVVGYRADAPAEGEESNLTLFFDIVPLDGEISETYELFVAPGQPYRFGPATN